MLGNYQFLTSDDPLRFDSAPEGSYDLAYHGSILDIGFACEIDTLDDGTCYRSGTLGDRDHWRLGFSRIAWDADGAFHVITPSTLARRI